ncbi:MAG TPA: hypothetical protein VGI27_11080, partial [Solirubrobacteraceae bacterium]
MNRCEYCAGQKAWVDVEMLVEDALEGDAPSALAILGTRTATLSQAAFRNGLREVARVLRVEFGARWARMTEYTTGYGPRAGGERRPHWNWAIKDVPADRVDELRARVVAVWCHYVDAEPGAQYVEPLRTPAAGLKYIGQHFSKADQRPPAGFKGQRFRCSHDYFAGKTVAQARAQARERDRKGVVRHKLAENVKNGWLVADAHELELLVHEAMRLSARTRWYLANERGVRLSKEPVPAVEPHWQLLIELQRARMPDASLAGAPADGRPPRADARERDSAPAPA